MEVEEEDRLVEDEAHRQLATEEVLLGRVVPLKQQIGGGVRQQGESSGSVPACRLENRERERKIVNKMATQSVSQSALLLVAPSLSTRAKSCTSTDLLRLGLSLIEKRYPVQATGSVTWEQRSPGGQRKRLKR